MCVCASRRGSRVAPAPLDSAQKVQAALQARQHRETQMALDRRAVTGATASTSGHMIIQPYLTSFTSSFSHHVSILTIFHIQFFPPSWHTYHLSHPAFLTILAYLPSFVSSFPHWYHSLQLRLPSHKNKHTRSLSHLNVLTILHTQTCSSSFRSKCSHHLSHTIFTSS